MSNLLKRGTTVNKDERIIDYNDIIREKLHALMEDKDERMDSDGLINGLNADVVEELISDDNTGSDADMEHAVTKEQFDEIIAGANAKADEIINNANNDAQSIIDEANFQSQSIYEDAKNRGFNEGMSSAQAEIDNKKAELEQEYRNKLDELNVEYEKKKAQIEPELVDVLTEVFKKVTMTVSEDNQDIILHLINNVMMHADNSKDFIIKVSPDDYKFLVNNQGKIYCAMSKEIQMDIVEDVTMKKNECIIETDTGVFNCSLDIELNNLIKDLKLLSCV